jgi:hypothetical protein
MMRKISIPAQPPRVLQNYAEMKIFSGLAAYFGFGIFILISVCFLIVAFVMTTGSEPGSDSFFRIIIPLIIFDTIGALLLVYGMREKQKRFLSFTRGVFIRGTVKGGGKKFVFWKSGSISTVLVDVTIPSGKTMQRILNLRSDELQQELFPGREINGLYDAASGSLFFPQEIGVDIEEG